MGRSAGDYGGRDFVIFSKMALTGIGVGIIVQMLVWPLLCSGPAASLHCGQRGFFT